MKKASPHRILIIDDEENMRHMLSRLLTKAGYEVCTAADGHSGISKLTETPYDFVLCDVIMPNMDGMEFLNRIQDHIGGTTVIMMSAYGTIETAISAMKLGAYDYISKPFNADEIILALKKAEERESLRQENVKLKQRVKQIEENYRFGNMVAKSKQMENVFVLSRKLAQLNTTVLISGESGTGKDLIARGIHHNGNRAGNPFIPVNCGGIPESLLESELFGYKKGAFTGAHSDRAGLFQEADGGTIFLDEIGEMPLSLQVKLLRVLQDKEVRAVGDAKFQKIDVRVIAATAKNLEEEIADHRFREDLYYRLNVMSITLPPLRERPEDIPVLARLFVRKFNKDIGRSIDVISPSAMARLMKHSWPGNVRELENVIERAVILCEKNILLPEYLPETLGIKAGNKRIDDFLEGFSIKEAQKEIEKRLIHRALEATAGNRTKASKLLEISHPSLLSKMKVYGIDM
ncbi:MAG: sigma-54 dependent transcriptional regulator [Desulfobacterales bacterium]